MDPTYPLVPIVNFLAFVLALVPLLTTGLFKKWNTGVCMFALWVAARSLMQAVNSIIWSDNVNVIAPIWCDITTHLNTGSLAAIPACSLVITRRICIITRAKGFATSRYEKRKELAFDLSLCLGLPIIVMSAFYYIVQGARFQIWEELGCANAISAGPLGTVLILGWAILLPTISVTFYCSRIIWVLYHQRKAMDAFLDSNLSMNRSNYYRVTALGLFDAVITLPIYVTLVISQVLQDIEHFPKSSFAHPDFSSIPRSPAGVWTKDRWAVLTVKCDEWIYPVFAAVFFLLFGLTENARATYGRTFWAALKPLGLNPPVKEDKPVAVSDIQFETVSPDGTPSSLSEFESAHPSRTSKVDLSLQSLPRESDPSSLSDLEGGTLKDKVPLADTWP